MVTYAPDKGAHPQEHRGEGFLFNSDDSILTRTYN
jgi:hypothetical protein